MADPLRDLPGNCINPLPYKMHEMLTNVTYDTFSTGDSALLFQPLLVRMFFKFEHTYQSPGGLLKT